MRVLEDDFSNAILVGTTFFPNGTGGGVFGFFNQTGHTITELTLQTVLAPNISPADIALNFVCNSSPANPFFLNCGIDYVGATGVLTIAFWGTNPITGTEGSSNFVGLHEGIPSLLPSCMNTPNIVGCTTYGHFAISLSNGLNLSDTVGGWGHDANPELFLVGQTIITVTELQTTFGAVPGGSLAPEPGTIGLMGGALAGIAWMRRRRRASWSAKNTG